MNKGHSLRIITIAIFSAAFCQMGVGQSDTNSYFPLEIGNEWIFQNDMSSTYTERITDTLRMKGHLYYGLTWDIAPYEWFRESNDSIYMIDVRAGIDTTNDTTEFLLYAFVDSIGATWDLPDGYGCSYGRAVAVADTSVPVLTEAGAFMNCYGFWHTTGCRDAGLLNSWFARGVGRVKYTEESYIGMRTYTLTSYIIVTDIKNVFDEPIITSHLLISNYPNPFNPCTTIRYTIPVKTFVVLRIIDLLGREVSILTSENRQPGMYEVLWDASDYPSGIYLAVLSMNDRSTIVKLVLVK